MKMIGLHQLADAAIQRQRRAGVAGRGTGGPAGADRVGVREGGRHAVVFEAARGVHALVLQEQLARLHADVPGHAVGRVQQRLPFADRDDLVRRGERQQLAESPDAAEAERLVAAASTSPRTRRATREPAASPSRRRRRAASRTRRSWCAPRRRRTSPRSRASRSAERRDRSWFSPWMPPQFLRVSQQQRQNIGNCGGAQLALRDSRIWSPAAT